MTPTKTRSDKEPMRDAVTELTNAIEEAQCAQRAIPVTPPGFVEPLRFIEKRASSLRTLELQSTSVRVDRNGKIIVGNEVNNAGETIAIEKAIFLNSRACQAGMGLTYLEHLTPKFVGQDGSKTMYFSDQPFYFLTVDPAEIKVVADGDDAPVLPVPVSLAQIDRDNQKSLCFSCTLTRKEQKLRGEHQTAKEVIAAILSGVPRALDAMAVQAILSKSPSQFSLSAAASSGARFDDLRALIGRNGRGALIRQDGTLTASGVRAELTPTMDETIVGDWSRSMGLIGPDISILVDRMSLDGDVNITAWVSVDVAIPNVSRFWVAQ